MNAFRENIKKLSEKIQNNKHSILTEEATKNAFIMPFIQILGFDPFCPEEVVPELNCDLVKQKGEKVDYAIMQNGNPIILIECKCWNQNLILHNTQLQKYFVASNCKFGILTNGITYQFYTDVDKANIMDVHPFFEFDLEDYKDSDLTELHKFSKEVFDENEIHELAEQLKYTKILYNIISEELENPGEELIKYFGKKVYDGPFTAKIIEKFTPFISHSIKAYLNDCFINKIDCAIDSVIKKSEYSQSEKIPIRKQIDTTQEELDAYEIVKSIIAKNKINDGVVFEDFITCFSVFLESNKDMVICSFKLGPKVKRIEIPIKGQKKRLSYQMSSIDEIFNYEKEILLRIEECKNI